ncbi:MAG: glycosyltransferase family 2 protein [bacterium]
MSTLPLSFRPVDCAVIIPTYNGRTVLGSCLDALYASQIPSGVTRDIIVVDNGSSDDTLDLIATDYPAVRVVHLERNTGFTGGIAAGVAATGSTALVFLNNDTRVDYLWLEALLAPLESPGIAAAGSILLDETEEKLDYRGGSANLFGWGFQQGHGEPVESIAGLTDPIPELFCCGGAMAIRRATYLEVGGFDPDYFAFFEDVDLGWRLNLAGYKCVVAPESRVSHLQSFTAKTMPRALRAFLCERNALTTMVKNLSDANLAELLPWAIALSLTRGLIDQGIERDRFFSGRWGDEVFGRRGKTNSEILIDEVADLKESGKRMVKETLLREGNQEDRGTARLLALESVLREWPKWLAKRETVQALRKVGDKQLMPLMADLLRAPLGHPREQAVMTLLGEWLRNKRAP